jgi:hypothetical protein
MNIGGHTCRNQLVRTLSNTEPERIALAGEVEDLELRSKVSCRIITSPDLCPQRIAHLHQARHCTR